MLNIIFVVAYDNSHGRIVLHELIKQRQIPKAIFFGSSDYNKRIRKNSIKRYLRQKGFFNLVWRIFHRMTKLKDVKAETLKESDSSHKSIFDLVREHNIEIIYFDKINSKESREKLRSFQPDFIILGGAPIVKKSFLEIPRLGVLNAHPGILPEAKGIDVVAHSILNDVPLGVTVFKVDEGIDSGPIIHKEYLSKTGKFDDISVYEAKVEALAGKAMLKAIDKIANNKNNYTSQKKNEGRLFRSMGILEYRKLKRKLKNIPID